VTFPEGYTARGATRADLDDVVALWKACDLADVGFEDPVREHVEQEWGRPDRDLDASTRLVYASDGSLVASAEVLADNPELSVETFARVHPDNRGRGLGSALLGWSEARAAELAPPGSATKLRNVVLATDERAQGLLARHGYRPVRTFWHMERALNGRVEYSPVQTGIEVRDYRADDAEALYLALEEAFADNWGSEPFPRDVFMQWMEQIDPALAGVALEGTEIAGAVISRTVEGTGWVDVVAVRRPWRGRGLARALLLRSFAELAGRGLRTVMLNVDAANETGATRLYERVGMHVRREWRLFERPLTSG
jgi:mycothiol synthase